KHQHQSNQTAHAGEGHGLQEELPGDVLALGANGLAQADFAGALGDADEHDVHHAHAADQQPNGAEHNHGQVHHHHDVVKLGDFLLRGGDGKIVFSAEGNVPAPLEDFADLVHGVIQHLGIRLRAHVDFVRVGISLLEGTEGDEHAAVLVAHGEAALGLFDHANNLKRRAVDHHVLADGMPLGEQHGSDVFPQHHHFLFVEIVAFTDEAPFDGGGVGINFAEVGLHAAEIDGGDVAGLGAHDVVVAPIGHHKNGHALYGGAALLNGYGVLEGERLALLLLERWRATHASLVPFGDERRVGPELIDAFLDFLIEAGEQGGHQHDHADAQDHAEYGQGAAQFVGAQSVQRLFQVFAVGLCHVCSSAFRAQRFDGVQLGRAHGWKNSKEKTN